MKKSAMRLSRRHEWWVYLASGIIFLSGAGWAGVRFLVSLPNEFGARETLQSWLLKIHGAAAMAVLFILGTLVPLHIKLAWRARRNLGTGLLLGGVLVFLTLTGYGLYYAGGEELRAWTSAAHLWIGFLFAPALVFHVWRGKDKRR